MGPGLKGAGAVAFLADYFVRHSPASFLLFAASDGILAVLTLAALAGSHVDARSGATVNNFLNSYTLIHPDGYREEHDLR